MGRCLVIGLFAFMFNAEVSFATSCLNNHSYEVDHDAQKVYFVIKNRGILSKKFVVEDANAKTFQVMEDQEYFRCGDDYGKDDKHAFYRMTTMNFPQALVKDLRRLSGGYFRSGDKVFFKETLMPNVDIKTFAIRAFGRASDKNYDYYEAEAAPKYQRFDFPPREAIPLKAAEEKVAPELSLPLKRPVKAPPTFGPPNQLDALYDEVMDHYKKGHYLKAEKALKRLHEVAPGGYKASKDIEWMVERQVGSETKSAEKRGREQKVIESTVGAYVKKCEPIVAEGASVEKVRECLKEAIWIAPDHPLLVEQVRRASRKK